MDFEKRLEDISLRTLDKEDKKIIVEILKILEKNRLTISKSLKILESTKEVLPKIVTLNKN